MSTSAVLFLDVLYRPLRVEPWQRAISDLFLGKGEVVEHSRDRTIRGVNRVHPMPAVVRVLRVAGLLVKRPRPRHLIHVIHVCFGK